MSAERIDEITKEMIEFADQYDINLEDENKDEEIMELMQRYQKIEEEGKKATEQNEENSLNEQDKEMLAIIGKAESTPIKVNNPEIVKEQFHKISEMNRIRKTKKMLDNLEELTKAFSSGDIYVAQKKLDNLNDILKLGFPNHPEFLNMAKNKYEEYKAIHDVLFNIYLTDFEKAEDLLEKVTDDKRRNELKDQIEKEKARIHSIEPSKEEKNNIQIGKYTFIEKTSDLEKHYQDVEAWLKQKNLNSFFEYDSKISLYIKLVRRGIENQESYEVLKGRLEKLQKCIDRANKTKWIRPRYVDFTKEYIELSEKVNQLKPETKVNVSEKIKPKEEVKSSEEIRPQVEETSLQEKLQSIKNDILKIDNNLQKNPENLVEKDFSSLEKRIMDFKNNENFTKEQEQEINELQNYRASLSIIWLYKDLLKDIMNQFSTQKMPELKEEVEGRLNLLNREAEALKTLKNFDLSKYNIGNHENTVKEIEEKLAQLEKKNDISEKNDSDLSLTRKEKGQRIREGLQKRADSLLDMVQSGNKEDALTEIDNLKDQIAMYKGDTNIFKDENDFNDYSYGLETLKELIGKDKKLRESFLSTQRLCKQALEDYPYKKAAEGTVDSFITECQKLREEYTKEDLNLVIPNLNNYENKARVYAEQVAQIKDKTSKESYTKKIYNNIEELREDQILKSERLSELVKTSGNEEEIQNAKKELQEVTDKLLLYESKMVSVNLSNDRKLYKEADALIQSKDLSALNEKIEEIYATLTEMRNYRNTMNPYIEKQEAIQKQLVGSFNQNPKDKNGKKLGKDLDIRLDERLVELNEKANYYTNESNKLAALLESDKIVKEENGKIEMQDRTNENPYGALSNFTDEELAVAAKINSALENGSTNSKEEAEELKPVSIAKLPVEEMQTVNVDKKDINNNAFLQRESEIKNILAAIDQGNVTVDLGMRLTNERTMIEANRHIFTPEQYDYLTSLANRASENLLKNPNSIIK